MSVASLLTFHPPRALPFLVPPISIQIRLLYVYVKMFYYHLSPLLRFSSMSSN